MPRLAVLSLALLAALPACKDTPSYRLRWTLGPDDDVADLAITRAFQCSQYGVGAVRVRAIDALGFTANEDIHPCFPEGFEDSDEKAEGPELRPGAYALEVRGVQRDLKEWIDTSPDEAKPDAECVPGAENLGCAREDLVCDCQEFEAVEDETTDDEVVADDALQRLREAPEELLELEGRHEQGRDVEEEARAIGHLVWLVRHGQTIDVYARGGRRSRGGASGQLPVARSAGR